MDISKMNMGNLFKLRSDMLLEGKDVSEINTIIENKENEYYNSLFEDTSATGGPAGSVGGGSVGSIGVAYGDASIAGMGNVVTSQPSINAGVTTEPSYTSGGGLAGTDLSVPYNTGSTKKAFQKIPVDNRKGNSKRRNNKVLAGLKQTIMSRKDFTANQGGVKKSGKILNWDSFSKDDLEKVTKIKE
jgi:hypothetical protein